MEGVTAVTAKLTAEGKAGFPSFCPDYYAFVAPEEFM
jgi:hypothetical protein